MTASAPASRPVMRWLRRIHRWLGLLLILPMAIQGLSGVVLLIVPAFEDVIAPAADSGLVPHGPALIVAAAQAGAPETLHAIRYRASGTTAIVDLAPAGQREAAQRVWVDPGTLQVLRRQERPDALYDAAHRLHEALLLPGPYGRSIIGWSGVLLLLMVATGIPLWWPAPGMLRRGLTVSRRARGARLQRELHGAVAIWLVVSLTIQAISGVSMAFPQAIRSALGLSPQRFERGRDGPAAPLDIAAITARLVAARPHEDLIELRLPGVPGRPVFAFLQDAGRGVQQVVAVVAPDGSRILSVDDPAQRDAAAALLAWLRSLHEARGLGPIWWLLVLAAGLALPTLGVTGGMLWLLRRRQRRAIARQRQAALASAPP